MEYLIVALIVSLWGNFQQYSTVKVIESKYESTLLIANECTSSKVNSRAKEIELANEKTRTETDIQRIIISRELNVRDSDKDSGCTTSPAFSKGISSRVSKHRERVKAINDRLYSTPINDK